MSSSQLLDPCTSDPGNLTVTRDFGLLGPAPNLAYYYDILLNLCCLFGATAMEQNSFYECYKSLFCYFCKPCNRWVGTPMIWVITVNSCHYWQERGREIYSSSYVPDSDIWHGGYGHHLNSDNFYQTYIHWHSMLIVNLLLNHCSLFDTHIVAIAWISSLSWSSVRSPSHQ